MLSQQVLPLLSEQVTLKGRTARIGKVTAPIYVICIEADIKNFPAGHIMVTEKTTPDYMAVFERAVGIITEVGGILSHAAIVSREFGIPCVVGVKELLAYTFDGQPCTLNADAGEVTLTKISTFSKKALIEMSLTSEGITFVATEDNESESYCSYCEESGHDTDNCEYSHYCHHCETQVSNDHFYDEVADECH